MRLCSVDEVLHGVSAGLVGLSQGPPFTATQRIGYLAASDTEQPQTRFAPKAAPVREGVGKYLGSDVLGLLNRLDAPGNERKDGALVPLGSASGKVSAAVWWLGDGVVGTGSVIVVKKSLLELVLKREFAGKPPRLSREKKMGRVIGLEPTASSATSEAL